MKPYRLHIKLFHAVAKIAISKAPNIVCNTLIFQGTKDILVKTKGSRKLASVIPNCEYVESSGFQHSILKSREAKKVLNKIKLFTGELTYSTETGDLNG